MQCFGIPFKPLGVRKMTKTVSCSNTTSSRDGDHDKQSSKNSKENGTFDGVLRDTQKDLLSAQVVLSSLVRHLTVKAEEGFY